MDDKAFVDDLVAQHNARVHRAAAYVHWDHPEDVVVVPSQDSDGYLVSCPKCPGFEYALTAIEVGLS